MFIRLGTDYRNNYYEYEIPLKVTPPGRYDNNRDEDRLIVWPEENRLDIELEIFSET
jgi:cell surface protein SprA